MSRGGPATALSPSWCRPGAGRPPSRPSSPARGRAGEGRARRRGGRRPRLGGHARPRRPGGRGPRAGVVAAGGDVGAARLGGPGPPFPRAALEEADALDEASVAGDRGRRDLRDQRVITIDPEGAKDHDDAIAIAPEARGRVAPVGAHRRRRALRPAGGALDREAARRGNSVYVPGAVVPMLPARLSSDLCSLRPGVDRAAVTAEMVIDADGRGGRDALLAIADPLGAAPDLPRGRRALRRRARRRGPRGATCRAAEVARRLRERRMGRGALEACRPSRSCGSRATASPRSASRARRRPIRWSRSA